MEELINDKDEDLGPEELEAGQVAAAYRCGFGGGAVVCGGWEGAEDWGRPRGASARVWGAKEAARLAGDALSIPLPRA
jgi:hypothetical protein